MTRAEKRTIKPGHGWAWAIEHPKDTWGLCHWAEPSKEKLADGPKPSPEAIPVRVLLTPVTGKEKP